MNDALIVFIFRKINELLVQMKTEMIFTAIKRVLLKTSIMKIVLISIVSLLFLNCNLENQVTIKIISIDSKTKIPRVNTFDTIEVNKEVI